MPFEKTFDIFEITKERVAARYRARPEHLNKRDVLHGGILAAMLDSIMGIHAAQYTKERGLLNAAATLNVSFLEAVREGEEVVAESLVQRAGKRLVFTESWARVEGRLVAHATGTHAVYAPKPEPGSPAA